MFGSPCRFTRWIDPVVPPYRLPPPDPLPDGLAPDLATALHGRSSGRARVLLAEDNSDLREYLACLLAPHYDVTEATDGLEAWDKLAADEFDVLVTDVMMPRLDGVGLLRRMRADARLGLLPAIVLTAQNGRDERLATLRIGIDDYVAKPFETQELLVRLANVVGNAARRRRAVAAARSEASSPSPSPSPPSSPAPVPATPSALEQLVAVARGGHADPGFGAQRFAQELAVSPRTLHRLCTEHAGLSPARLITEVRLARARRLLEADASLQVKAVAAAVGYRSADGFARAFRDRYGIGPRGLHV